MGQILNGQGGSVAGVRVAMVDLWGTRAEAVSKSGDADFGLFDFSTTPQSQYTLTVMDENGRRSCAHRG
jgi:hypothetical protein